MPTMSERMATVEAKLAAAELSRADRDREIRQIKDTIKGMDGKLDQLVEDKAHRDGALGLGRWMVSIGVPSLIGGWVLALWHLFGGKN